MRALACALAIVRDARNPNEWRALGDLINLHLGRDPDPVFAFAVESLVEVLS